MKRKKHDAFEQDEKHEPISLMRIEVRTEMVPLTDEERVERGAIAAGIESEISAQEYRLLDASETVKRIKTAIENKTTELRAAVREAHDGHKGSDFDCIVERHHDHPAEMIVWRAPMGVDVTALLEEAPREGETTIALRERQGCSLVEVRAMSGEEMDAAEAEDHKARHPELPIDGLDAPVAEVIVSEEGRGEVAVIEANLPETDEGKEMTDEEWESEPFLTDNPPVPITDGKKKGKRGRKVA